MLTYLIQRLLQGLIVIFLVSLLTFLVMQAAPGDPVRLMAGGMAPVLDTVLPLDGFADALRRLESRQVFGKIVVTL